MKLLTLEVYNSLDETKTTQKLAKLSLKKSAAATAWNLGDIAQWSCVVQWCWVVDKNFTNPILDQKPGCLV